MMKIEIKSIGGNVLYTAEADNVRAALQQVVKARADLSGADLNADAMAK